MKIEQFRVDTQGATLHGYEYGEGDQDIVFLNGAFGTTRDWKHVLGRINGNYRSLVYDMRGRGRSKASDEYSFTSCEKDLETLLSARKITKPILVGWSYGAALAVRYAAHHPDAVRAIVLIDGAFPVRTFVTDNDREKVRQLWRRMRWLLPLLSKLGKAGKMSADGHAAINLELDDLLGSFGEEFAKVTCPVRFITATERSYGGTTEQFEALRASLKPLTAKHSNIAVFAELPCTHLEILHKYPQVVVEAIVTV